jgi:hypothetical protein
MVHADLMWYPRRSRFADPLVMAVARRVEELLATHRLLSGPRRDPVTLPAGQQVISASHTGRQTTLLVRTSDPVPDPAWTVSEVGAQMTWLTWRQFRVQAATAIMALAAFAILLAATTRSPGQAAAPPTGPGPGDALPGARTGPGATGATTGGGRCPGATAR